MMDGIILKALSGFYYVDCGQGQLIVCRARGKFRHSGQSPLVGDHVALTLLEDGSGMVDRIYPRRNEFQRPAVSNLDQLVIVASGAIPITDPFLIDRMTAIAEGKGCEPIICINKCDLDSADELFHSYTAAGFITLRVSATKGKGLEQLRELLSNKVSAFTGNSGVGKSSLLNALQPNFQIPVNQVSEKLGRGRHTTRHIELYSLDNGATVADTPGFSSFDVERMELRRKEDLATAFRDFQPYLEQCRFVGCTHRKEKGCAVLAALRAGHILPSRHASYVRLYEQLSKLKSWER